MVDKRKRLIVLLLLASQVFTVTQAAAQSSQSESSEVVVKEFIAEVSQADLKQASTNNPAFQAGLEVYGQFLSEDQLTFRDLSGKGQAGSSLADVLRVIETDVAVSTYEQGEQTNYLLYEFDISASDNTGHHHLAELIVFFTEDQLEYIGLSSITMNYDAKNVLLEAEAIAYSEPGTSLTDLLSLEPVLVGIGHSYFNGENYTSLSFPSFASLDDLVYEFSLFNQQEAVVYNYIVNSSSRNEQPSSYLLNLHQEFFNQTIEKNEAETSHDQTEVD